MAQLTTEQKRTLAIAQARRRRAEAERKAGSRVSPDDVARGLARGVPVVGSFLDELNAATNATLAPVLDPILPEGFEKLPDATWRERYARALRLQRDRDEAFDREHPGLSTGLQVTGGVASALPLAATATGARLLGMGGQTMLGRMLASGASGGAIGFGHGFGSGKDFSDRLRKGTVGGLVGGGVGLAVPPASWALGKTFSGARSGARKIGGLFGLGDDAAQSSRAERALSDAAARDALSAERLADLGDDAMLLDAGPNLRQQAAVIAAAPGRGQKTVRDAISRRAAGATGRVTSAMDDALGPNWNVVQTVDDLTALAREQSRPLYETFYRQPIKITEAIEGVLKTPSGKSALAKAVRLAADEGAQIDPSNLDARGLDYVKRGLDALYQRARDDQTRRAIDGLRRQFIRAIDEQTPTYAAARSVYSGQASMRDALESGLDVFNRSVSPDQLRADLAKMSEAERRAFMIGARAQVAEIMGTARNEPAAATREFLDKGWNREKLSLLLGDDPAEKLIRTLRSEKTFADTANIVTRNSETASRLAGQAAFDAVAKKPPGFVESLLNLEFGTAGKQLLRSTLGRMSAADAEKMGAEAAEILTAHGAERDRIVQLLTAIQQDRVSSQQVRDNATRLLRSILQTGNVGAVPSLVN